MKYCDDKILEKIHPLKRYIVEKIGNNDFLYENCKEIWIFGSTTVNQSDHTEKSDIDIAVRTGVKDLCDKRNNDVGMEFAKIFRGDETDYDLLFLDIIRDTAKIKERIFEGVRLWSWWS